jgi:acyl-CoA synthetase (AMP-forming)/AMP-acid ligase II
VTPDAREIPVVGRLSRVRLGKLGAVGEVPAVLRELVETGIVHPVRPDKLARMTREFVRWGTSPATAVGVQAIEEPDRKGLVDEVGELTYRDLHERSNGLARALLEDGVGAGDGIAIMCRNHRWFVDATLAAAKIGASVLYMNTGFAAPQFKDVVEREEPSVLIYDEEFAEVLEPARKAGGRELRCFLGWREEGSDEPPDRPIQDLIDGGDPSDLTGPESDPRFVILTSGTTGTPKGAQRSAPTSLAPVTAMLSRLGLHAREITMIAAPLFHSWGFAHLQMAQALGSTTVVRGRFDPEETLKAVERTRATTLAVVPVMLQRILDLPEETLRKYDLSSLRVTAVSGSALPGELSTRWMDLFGDNVYNLYGSTEVAYATIASPNDLREAPGTAGRPPRGSVVKIFDEDDNEVPPGETGRIFVGNEFQFEGYTGGESKEMVDGLMSSGDVGHFDEEGRLFIDGRDDEMIVSGGENVFPREVEELLSQHDAIAEAAVIGVDDEKFGQRLKAFIVKSDGKNISEDEVKKHVKSNLANYKVPREVEFLDELPRNQTGKVVKRELAEKPDDDGSADKDAGGEPAEKD